MPGPDLVGELYLTEKGRRKKKPGNQRKIKAMENLKVPTSRIEHLKKQQDPALLAALVKELQAKR